MNTNQKAKLSKLIIAAAMLGSRGHDLMSYHTTPILSATADSDEDRIDRGILELAEALRDEEDSGRNSWFDPKSGDKFKALIAPSLR